jgi:hypothetical protein
VETESNRYVAILNAMTDLWTIRLSHAEFKAAMWIIGRTIRFDKGAEIIPRRHVLKGVPNWPTGPVGMSYRGWLNCVRALESEGLIQVEITEYGFGIQIVHQRILKGPKEGRT